MKIIHAVVTTVKHPIEPKAVRSVTFEWLRDYSTETGAKYQLTQYFSIDDPEGEFAMGDKVSITLTKVM